MKQTVAHYSSAIHGRVTVTAELDPHEQPDGTFALGWCITKAVDEDGRELEIPEFEQADARDALGEQSLADCADFEREQAWLADCGEDLYAMTDEDLDAFEVDAQGYIAAAGAR